VFCICRVVWERILFLFLVDSSLFDFPRMSICSKHPLEESLALSLCSALAVLLFAIALRIFAESPALLPRDLRLPCGRNFYTSFFVITLIIAEFILFLELFFRIMKTYWLILLSEAFSLHFFVNWLSSCNIRDFSRIS